MTGDIAAVDQGHRYRYLAVDLAGPGTEIRAALLAVTEQNEGQTHA